MTGEIAIKGPQVINHESSQGPRDVSEFTDLAAPRPEITDAQRRADELAERFDLSPKAAAEMLIWIEEEIEREAALQAERLQVAQLRLEPRLVGQRVELGARGGAKRAEHVCLVGVPQRREQAGVELRVGHEAVKGLLLLLLLLLFYAGLRVSVCAPCRVVLPRRSSRAHNNTNNERRRRPGEEEAHPRATTRAPARRSCPARA